MGNGKWKRQWKMEMEMEMEMENGKWKMENGKMRKLLVNRQGCTVCDIDARLGETLCLEIIMLTNALFSVNIICALYDNHHKMHRILHYAIHYSIISS